MVQPLHGQSAVLCDKGLGRYGRYLTKNRDLWDLPNYSGNVIWQILFKNMYVYTYICIYKRYIYIYKRQTKTVLLVGPKWLIPPIAVYEEHDEIYHKLLLNRKMMRYTISKSKDKHQFLVFHKGLVSTGNIKDYPWLRKCVGILGLLGF
jgi:hypothetical protein